MLRTARKITPLVCSLVFGVAGVTAISAVAAVVAGCEDENKPEYYIKRLDDPAVRPAAVKRLGHFYEMAMTQAADKNREDPNVKALVDKMVPPLTKTYLAGNLDDRTRGEIIKLLADTRDKRAKDAWVKALKDYQPGISEDEVKASARAIADTGIRDADATDAMLSVFLKFEAGSPKGEAIYLDFKKAMVEVSSPSWKPQLIERLNRPMEMVGRDGAEKADPLKIRSYKNEQFWQITAAEILGNVRAADAIKPLFKAIIDPNKADVAATAVVALVKIGKDTTAALTDALLGKDTELNQYASTAIKSKDDAAVAPIRTAALVIGTIGRADGVKPLLTALEKTDPKDVITRAIIARELAKLPPSPESLKAFLDVLSKTPPSAVIPPGAPATSTLIESLTQFQDPSVVDFLIKLGNDIKGDDDDKQVVRDGAMASMIKLMRKDQVPAVEKAIKDWAPKENDSKLEKDAFQKAKSLLDACGDKVECYLAKIEEPAVQEKEQQFVGIKASYMLGILGNDSTRMEIVKRLPRIKNGALKFSAVQALDHLAPNGDAAVADQIAKMLETDQAKGDPATIQNNAPVRQVMYRLQARL